MKIALVVLVLLVGDVMAEESQDRLLNCRDVPSRQGIVCEKKVTVICPYDERRACYQMKGN